MLRAALAAALLVLAALYLAPSTTPYSPYNPGPDGLSELAKMCKMSDGADVIILAPGVSLPDLNITAATTRIADPVANFGSPYTPAARVASGAGALAAPNATPLAGRGVAIVYTSPASFAGPAPGPHPLALAVSAGNRTVYVYHASLFTNLALRWNLDYARQVCAMPVRVVVTGGDPAHVLRERLDRARPWIAPASLAAASLYLTLKRAAWRSRRGR
jgi:hypothetical protein